MNLPVLWAWIDAKFSLKQDERGANLVEYVLLLAFIALVVIAIVIGLGKVIKGKFEDASDQLSS